MKIIVLKELDLSTYEIMHNENQPRDFRRHEVVFCPALIIMFHAKIIFHAYPVFASSNLVDVIQNRVPSSTV